MNNKSKIFLALAVAVGLSSTISMDVSAATLKDYFDAKYYASLYPDLQKAYGNDEKGLYEHYITFGIKEGRSASRVFNVKKYRENYADLDAAFGDNWDAYANHYATYGIKEGRDAGGDGLNGMDAYAETYYDTYAAYGPNFFVELEKGDELGKTLDRDKLITPYYAKRNALTVSSQSAEVRHNVDNNFEWAETELNYASWYYIAYLNADDDDLKDSFGRLYNGCYQNLTKYRDYVLLNGTKEDADEWFDKYHEITGANGFSRGHVLPQEVAVSD